MTERSNDDTGDRPVDDAAGMGGAGTATGAGNLGGSGGGDLGGSGSGAGAGGLGSTGDPGGASDLGGAGAAGTEAGDLTGTETAAPGGPGDVREQPGDLQRSGPKPDTNPAR
jgi:hypothetical protein